MSCARAHRCRLRRAPAKEQPALRRRARERTRRKEEQGGRENESMGRRGREGERAEATLLNSRAFDFVRSRVNTRGSISSRYNSMVGVVGGGGGGDGDVGGGGGGDANHFVFRVTSGYSSHGLANGADPIFPGGRDYSSPLCRRTRESCKIPVRWRTLLICEWLLLRVKWLHLPSLARRNNVRIRPRWSFRILRILRVSTNFYVYVYPLR